MPCTAWSRTPKRRTRPRRPILRTPPRARARSPWTPASAGVKAARWRGPPSLHFREAEVHASVVRLGPAARDHLAAGVEVDAFLAVDVRVAEERALPASERVVGDGHGNGDVDADHAH